ncbi:Glycoprotease family protein [Diplocarpon rosae]|nr:Glycoprotease family protein [Diplocarpon rosae]
MSTSTSTAPPPKSPEYAPSRQNNNPFENPSDDDDGDNDQWWDEEHSIGSTPSRGGGIRITEWPKPPTGLGVSFNSGNRSSTRKTDKRYSVQKPTRDKSKRRQRKQNAEAGIKLVTNFSRHHAAEPPVQLQASRTMPQMGRFVDLAALQALDGETSQHSTGFWRTKKNKELASVASTMPSLSREATQPSTSSSGKAHARNFTNLQQKPSNNMNPSPSRLADDLSPNDRPIVIGISIPTANAADHTLSPQTAASETTRIVRSYEHRTPLSRTPDTPTIIITPAQETAIWSPLNQRGTGYRPTSSMYPVNGKVYTADDAPPIPQMPVSVLEEERRRIAVQRSYFSPDLDDATTWDDGNDTSRSRAVSSCTLFEEDESPILARTGRAISLSAGSKWERHASINTIATCRRSKGWWNYITTPFLTRSNTFATRGIDPEAPPAPAVLPSLATAAAKAQFLEEKERTWEKQFSPLTPETSTTITSDRCWGIDSKQLNSPDRSPILRETRHKPQTSTGTLPMVLSETAGFGTATMSSFASASSSLSRENTVASLQLHTGFHSTDRVVPILNDAPRSPPTNNPFVQPRLSDLNQRSSTIQPLSRAIEVFRSGPSTNAQSIPSLSTGPPPPYSPSPTRVKYHAVFPLGHPLGVQTPASPGPLSPGLQQAISSGGAIPMSTVPLTPSGSRQTNPNSGYPELPPRHINVPVVGEHYGLPPREAIKAEAKRKRHEKEDAAARRAGGWWRGRGCIPDRGCYGRAGAEGRKRRRWYGGLTVGFVLVIIIAVALATTLHRKSNTITEPSQWVNLTGFPPMFLGLSTVAAPANIRANTGCVFPATQWSCDLPKELQESVAPSLPNQPNFFLHVQWDNSSATNATFANVTGGPDLVNRRSVASPVSAGQLIKRFFVKSRQVVTFVPLPSPPSYAEEVFLGNSTDGIIAANKAGEPTPFYISFLSSPNSAIQKREVIGRQKSEHSSDSFPNITSIIPPPSRNADGTAAPANLLPFPTQQPVRLYDRGLSTEHYGFYTYFDRTIFLKSLALLNSSNLENGEVPGDRNGGATESEAAFRCTWTQTRFLVQIWTRMNTTSQLLNSTLHLPSPKPASDLTQPGSFPYPITLTTDRHGGDPSLKMVYCYSLDDREGFVEGSAKINEENRGFGGSPFNPAPTFFANESIPTLGGFDGGTGGCSCQWSNFRTLTKAQR